MLINHFQNELSPEVVRITCQLYYQGDSADRSIEHVDSGVERHLIVLGGDEFAMVGYWVNCDVSYCVCVEYSND